MKKKYLFIILVLSFLITPSVNAKRSEEFIEHVKGIIENDCAGQKIQKREIQNTKTYYDYNDSLGDLLTYFNTFSWSILMSPGSRDSMSAFGGSSDVYGSAIIICGEHYLNISKGDYYWDGEKIELPREVNVHNEAIGNVDSNIVQGCNNTQIQLQLNDCEVNLEDTKIQLNNSKIDLKNNRKAQIYLYGVQYKVQNENIWLKFWKNLMLQIIVTLVVEIVAHYFIKFINKRRRKNNKPELKKINLKFINLK